MSGEPGGYPLIGSVRKIPAPRSPTAQTPKNNGPQNDPLTGPEVRRIPKANKSVREPVTRKLSVCVQPWGPRASELTGCRNGS
ncbi:hypothetical protein GCM10009678_84600 [Actinomadura kijaniata]|uniref:Uncharacterized protein n=1 Tax=Actinomadura namibiensis TaxID=182080 RepID=A0A7W3LVL5_ACTNM|nr:hypothetical protein [Actinomadura namibiensis]